jgi:uncharacterized protein (DUF433 family)
MPTTVSYPHIEKPAGEAARVARLPRVRVSHIVLPHLMHGWSAEELARQYPHLSLAEIHAALGYYFDHAEEIAREIEADLAEDERLRAQAAANSFMTRLRAKLRT